MGSGYSILEQEKLTTAPALTLVVGVFLFEHKEYDEKEDFEDDLNLEGNHAETKI